MLKHLVSGNRLRSRKIVLPVDPNSGKNNVTALDELVSLGLLTLTRRTDYDKQGLAAIK